MCDDSNAAVPIKTKQMNRQIPDVIALFYGGCGQLNDRGGRGHG
jgi:hypothetical protein